MGKRVMIIIAALACRGPALCEQYSIISLGTFGGIESGAEGINDDGFVVGTVRYEGTSEQPFPTDAFLWSPSQTVMLAQTMYQVHAYGVNNSCRIVGEAKETVDGETRAFSWDGASGIQYFAVPESATYSTAFGANNSGQATVYSRQSDDYWALKNVSYVAGDFGNLNAISFPTPIGGIAAGISDAGHVAGWACPSLEEAGTDRAYIWKDGQLSFLDGLGGNSDMALCVNSFGVAVGRSALSAFPAPGINPSHAVLWTGGRVYDLGTLGGDNSAALAMNEGGLAVGYAEIADGTHHACLWQGTEILDLNAFLPSACEWDYLASATGVNIYGQIVGVGVINGVEQAFVMTPVPEPATYLLLGLGGIGLLRKRRAGDLRGLRAAVCAL